ncbi:hypothetical protein GCM10025795_05240 [Verticiella sediminum]
MEATKTEPLAGWTAISYAPLIASWRNRADWAMEAAGDDAAVGDAAGTVAQALSSSAAHARAAADRDSFVLDMVDSLSRKRRAAPSSTRRRVGRPLGHSAMPGTYHGPSPASYAVH